MDPRPIQSRILSEFTPNLLGNIEACAVGKSALPTIGRRSFWESRSPLQQGDIASANHPPERRANRPIERVMSALDRPEMERRPRWIAGFDEITKREVGHPRHRAIQNVLGPRTDLADPPPPYGQNRHGGTMTWWSRHAMPNQRLTNSSRASPAKGFVTSSTTWLVSSIFRGPVSSN